MSELIRDKGVFWCLGVKLVDSLWIFCMHLLFSLAFYTAFTLLFKCRGSINLGLTQSDHRESISWHVLVPWPVPVPGSVCVCACGTEQNRGKWKSSYAGASHRCPAPPPIHITACSVCIPLWHCPNGALNRPAGGPINRESMSVELPRECEWSRLFLNFGSSERK